MTNDIADAAAKVVGLMHEDRVLSDERSLQTWDKNVNERRQIIAPGEFPELHDIIRSVLAIY